MTMLIDPKTKALYALRRLPGRLKSDVLADGAIAARYDIQTTHPVRISQETTLSQNKLFDAFRQSMGGEAVSPLLDQNGEAVEATISVDQDSTGIVQTANRQLRFENVGLLSADAAQRGRLLEKCLAEHTLAGRYRTELREIIDRPDFSNEDFLRIIQGLSTSPENFGEQLRQKLDTRQIGEADLIPEDIRHWDNLLAPVEGSLLLSEFLEGELAEERRSRFASNPQQAMRSISLGFCAPGLAPLAMLREFDADTVLAMVETAVDFEDHFGLAGALEICADWIERDSRFAPVGEKLMERLFGDMPRLSKSCGMFAAAFIIAIAHLGRHETLRRKPAFWRRLAGAAQASLVVRASGPVDIDETKLVSWAMFLAAKPYFLSVFLDMDEEPRWRPEWIYPHFLIADAIGRVKIAITRLPEGVAPREWKNRFDEALKWIEDQKIEPLEIFPAIGECGRRPQQPTLAELKGDLADIYSGLAGQQTVNYLVRMTPLIFTFGFPAELNDKVLALMEALRRDASTLEDQNVQMALATATHIAVQGQNTDLADAVANVYFEKANSVTDAWTAVEAMFRLVECAAADPNRVQARSTLTRRLENLALILPRPVLPQFLDGIEVVQSLGDDLAVGLGRARAAARLGVTPDAA